MPNLPETSSFDAVVYELQTTDPVQGGDQTAVSNKQAAALTNRTRFLNDAVAALTTRVTTLETEVATPPGTLAAGNDSTSAASTAFVHRAAGGFASVDCSGAGNITLTTDQWGCAVILLTGARTADGNIVFPTRAAGDRWLVVNRCTGGKTLTCKTLAGTGVVAAQGLSKDIWCDATNILNAETDLASRPKIVTAVTTAVAGDDLIADQAGGAFSINAISGPSVGDRFKVSGNYAGANLTVSRNGSLIFDQNGVGQANDYVANRNNLSALFTYVTLGGVSGWLITQG